MARILIAAHTDTTAEYLQGALRKSGHMMLRVDNCADAWHVSGDEYFDVMMIDVNMPGMDSFLMAQRASEENPLIQIMFITGFSGVLVDTMALNDVAPTTSRPFHLKNIATRINWLMTGYTPATVWARDDETTEDGTVVYANFRTAAAQ